MENQNTRGCLLAISIVVIIALMAAALVWVVQSTIQRSIDQAVSPVENVAGGLSTQVARVLNPTPTIFADPVTIVRQVKAVARLETIHYEVEKVITAEVGQESLGFLFGDRLLFVAHGTVIAGVDMGKMGPEDVRVENGVLFVRLPEPEIFIATLNNEKSYVYDRDTGLLTRGDVNLETNARRAAEDAIEQAALEGEILNQARQNAETYFERLFRDMGYNEVVFEE
jgi:hypothetical protein